MTTTRSRAPLAKPSLSARRSADEPARNRVVGNYRISALKILSAPWAITNDSIESNSKVTRVPTGIPAGRRIAG